VSKRLLCRRAVGGSEKGEDPRQSIVAASELGSAPSDCRLAPQADVPPSISQRSQPKHPHRFASRVSISGRLAGNPRPTQNIIPPSLAYPASDPLISRQFSAPTLLAQALQYPRSIGTHSDETSHDSCRIELDFLPCSEHSKSVSAPAVSASDSSCPP